jgi:hypothetical protein
MLRVTAPWWTLRMTGIALRFRMTVLFVDQDGGWLVFSGFGEDLG